MGHLLPPESVKIKITINYPEEPVSKSSLTPNTPTALLTHPFPSAPLCLASLPQESWQLQQRATASASRCRSAPVLQGHAAPPPAPQPPPAARPSLRVPAEGNFRPGSEACHIYKAPFSGAQILCFSHNGSKETMTTEEKGRERKQRLPALVLHFPFGPPPFSSRESNA